MNNPKNKYEKEKRPVLNNKKAKDFIRTEASYKDLLFLRNMAVLRVMNEREDWNKGLPESHQVQSREAYRGIKIPDDTPRGNNRYSQLKSLTKFELLRVKLYELDWFIDDMDEAIKSKEGRYQ